MWSCRRGCRTRRGSSGVVGAGYSRLERNVQRATGRCLCEGSAVRFDVVCAVVAGKLRAMCSEEGIPELFERSRGPAIGVDGGGRSFRGFIAVHADVASNGFQPIPDRLAALSPRKVSRVRAPMEVRGFDHATTRTCAILDGVEIEYQTKQTKEFVPVDVMWEVKECTIQDDIVYGLHVVLYRVRCVLVFEYAERRELPIHL